MLEFNRSQHLQYAFSIYSSLIATISQKDDVIEAHCYGADKGSDWFSSEHVAGQ